MKDINRLTPAERFTYYTGLWLNDDQKDPEDDQEDDECGS